MKEIKIPGVTVERLRPEHNRIVPHLRASDEREMRAMSDMEPGLCVAYSIVHSRPGYAVMRRGEPVVLFGAVPSANGAGVPWLVASDEIERHPVAFYRASRLFIPEIREGYSYLENWVHVKNYLSVRWLKWAGFTLDEREGDFFRFWWRRM